MHATKSRESGSKRSRPPTAEKMRDSEKRKRKGAGRRHRRKHEDSCLKSICVDGSIGKDCMQLVNLADRAMERKLLRTPTSPLLSALTSCSLADSGQDFHSPYSKISEVDNEREIQNSLHSSGGSTGTNPTVSNSGYKSI